MTQEDIYIYINKVRFTPPSEIKNESLTVVLVGWIPGEAPLEVFSLLSSYPHTRGYGGRCTTPVRIANNSISTVRDVPIKQPICLANVANQDVIYVTVVAMTDQFYCNRMFKDVNHVDEASHWAAYRQLWATYITGISVLCLGQHVGVFVTHTTILTKYKPTESIPDLDWNRFTNRRLMRFLMPHKLFKLVMDTTSSAVSQVVQLEQYLTGPYAQYNYMICAHVYVKVPRKILQARGANIQITQLIIPNKVSIDVTDGFDILIFWVSEALLFMEKPYTTDRGQLIFPLPSMTLDDVARRRVIPIRSSMMNLSDAVYGTQKYKPEFGTYLGYTPTTVPFLYCAVFRNNLPIFVANHPFDMYDFVNQEKSRELGTTTAYMHRGTYMEGLLLPVPPHIAVGWSEYMKNVHVKEQDMRKYGDDVKEYGSTYIRISGERNMYIYTETASDKLPRLLKGLDRHLDSALEYKMNNMIKLRLVPEVSPPLATFPFLNEQGIRKATTFKPMFPRIEGAKYSFLTVLRNSLPFLMFENAVSETDINIVIMEMRVLDVAKDHMCIDMGITQEDFIQVPPPKWEPVPITETEIYQLKTRDADVWIPSCRGAGIGIQRAVVGVPAHLKVYICDRFGKPVYMSRPRKLKLLFEKIHLPHPLDGLESERVVSCNVPWLSIQTKDIICITYTINLCGEYYLKILLGGLEISGSPFRVKVHTGELDHQVTTIEAPKTSLIESELNTLVRVMVDVQIHPDDVIAIMNAYHGVSSGDNYTYVLEQLSALDSDIFNRIVRENIVIISPMDSCGNPVPISKDRISVNAPDCVEIMSIEAKDNGLEVTYIAPTAVTLLYHHGLLDIDSVDKALNDAEKIEIYEDEQLVLGHLRIYIDGLIAGSEMELVASNTPQLLQDIKQLILYARERLARRSNRNIETKDTQSVHKKAVDKLVDLENQLETFLKKPLPNHGATLRVWDDIRLLRNEIYEFTKNNSVLERKVVAAYHEAAKDIASGMKEESLLKATKYNHHRETVNAIIPSIIALQEQMLRNQSTYSANVNGLIRKLKNKEFNTLDDLILTNQHLARELKNIHALDSAVAIENLNSALIIELHLKWIDHILKNKAHGVEKLESYLEDLFKKLEARSKHHQEISKKIDKVEKPKEEPTVSKKIQTDDLLNRASSTIFSKLVWSRMTGEAGHQKNMDSSQLTDLLLEGYKDCKTGVTGREMQYFTAILSGRPNLRVSLIELFHYYNGNFFTRDDIIEESNRFASSFVLAHTSECCPGITKQIYLTFLHDLKLDNSAKFLEMGEDIHPYITLFDKFATCKDSSSSPVLCLLMFVSVIRELGYIDYIMELLSETLFGKIRLYNEKHGTAIDPAVDTLPASVLDAYRAEFDEISKLDRITAFLRFLKVSILPLYQYLVDTSLDFVPVSLLPVDANDLRLGNEGNRLSDLESLKGFMKWINSFKGDIPVEQTLRMTYTTIVEFLSACITGNLLSSLFTKILDGKESTYVKKSELLSFIQRVGRACPPSYTMPYKEIVTIMDGCTARRKENYGLVQSLEDDIFSHDSEEAPDKKLDHQLSEMHQPKVSGISMKELQAFVVIYITEITTREHSLFIEKQKYKDRTLRRTLKRQEVLNMLEELLFECVQVSRIFELDFKSKIIY